MAFVNIEDQTGVIEVTVFPNIYGKFAQYMKEGEVLLITGTISLKEEETPKILCNSILLKSQFGLSEAVFGHNKQERGASENKLFMKLESKSDERAAIIYEILKQYPGSGTAFFFYNDSKKYAKIPTGYAPQKQQELVNKISHIISSDNVVLK